MIRRANVRATIPMAVFAVATVVLAVMKTEPSTVIIAILMSSVAAWLGALWAVRVATERVIMRVFAADTTFRGEPLPEHEIYSLPWSVAFRGLGAAVFDPKSYAMSRMAVSFQTYEFPSALATIRSTGFARTFGPAGVNMLARLRQELSSWTLTPMPWDGLRPSLESAVEAARDASPEAVIEYLTLPVSAKEALYVMHEGIPLEYARSVVNE